MGTLGELAHLSIGDIMELNATPQSRVAVECNGDRLMWCHLGKQNAYYTLRVDAFVDRERSSWRISWRPEAWRASRILPAQHSFSIPCFLHQR